MYTIDRIPAVCRRFVHPHRKNYDKLAWPRFWGLGTVMAMASEHTVERLNGLLRNHAHPTNDGEVLWRRDWDGCWEILAIAMD